MNQRNILLIEDDTGIQAVTKFTFLSLPGTRSISPKEQNITSGRAAKAIAHRYYIKYG